MANELVLRGSIYSIIYNVETYFEFKDVFLLLFFFWGGGGVVVLGFYIPPTAKVIQRWDLGLKSHPKDLGGWGG